tara:strand:- start:361793 stop:362776 length:984 start_codon:yes stop_codon:yes gene_type:complete
VTKPLEVTITVGTSFSIGGAFKDPENNKPVGERSVLCDGNGLNFVLDTFNRYNTNASFFIETANHAYFGDRPMVDIANRIIKAGHDTQLLVHPCWYYYDKSGDYSQDDSCAGRDYKELKTLLEKSIETFERWCDKKPQAIRAGNYQIDKQFYKVVHDIGIPISSSIGLGMHIADGKEMLLYSGRSKICDVMEVPLFTYQDKDIMGRYPTKTLQIASCSWREMRYILQKARRTGVENIVLVTQPFDYIKKKDVQYTELTRNRINQERLEKLCSFIAEHDQDYITVDFASKADEWQQSEAENIKRFKVPTRFRNARKIENLINDIFWNY